MSGNILDISNIIEVSVAANQAGAGEYSPSNIALFTEEVYASSFGTLGYQIYLSPTQVGIDFGTGSKTYQMALALFSQQPNILAGGGYLVIIPFLPQVDQAVLSASPSFGSFKLIFPGGTTAFIPYTATSSQVASYVQAVTGQSNTSVVGYPASQTMQFVYNGVYGSTAQVQVTSNNMSSGTGSTAVSVTVTTPSSAELIGPAITRSMSLVEYFGILGTDIFPQADTLAAAAIVQATTGKMAGFVSRSSADVQPGGLLDLLRSGDFDQSRGLYYGGSTDISALTMLAAYFGRAMSVDFSGSNTTITMQLKDLVTIQPDPSMNQTLYNACQTAGVDIYANIRGISKVLTSGENGGFFDEIYNLQAFIADIQLAYFNLLAETPTKIPQTDGGMNSARQALRAVCDQYVGNQYIAPGTWTSATTFGNQNDFLSNILQKGYYIYIPPVSTQSQANRAARIAPLAQIAIKEAGAVHKGNVVIYINP